MTVSKDNSFVSVKNCSATPLGISETFTGEWEELTGYTGVIFACKTDASGILYLEFSNDRSSPAASSLAFNIDANVNEVHSYAKTRQFFRLRLVNGTSAQTYLDLYADCGSFRNLTSPSNGTVSDDADSQVVRAIPGNLDIASGRRQGYELFEKFGENQNVSNAGNEDIWDGSTLYTGFPTTAETVQAVCSSPSDALGGVGAEILTLRGLDENFLEVTENLTLNGGTSANTTTTFIRLDRAFVIQSANGANTAFNVGTITIRQSTTTSVIFCVMPALVNQTRIACYTVPADKTLLLSEIDVDISKAGGTSVTATGGLYRKDFGLAPRIIEPFSVSDTLNSTDIINEGIALPPKCSIAIRIITCSANNTTFFGKLRGYLVTNRTI